MAPRRATAAAPFKRRLLLTGESGAGKTHFIGTAQKVKELADVLVIPFDSGDSTLNGTDALVEEAKTLAEAEKVLWALAQGAPEYKSVKTLVLDGWGALMKRTLADIADQAAKNTADSKKPRDRDTNQLSDYLLRNNRSSRILRMACDLQTVSLLVVTGWPKKKFPMTLGPDGKEMPDQSRAPLEITPNFSDKMLDEVVGGFDDSWHILHDKAKERRLVYTSDFENIKAKTRGAAFAAELGTKQDGKFFPVLVNPDFQTIVDAYYRAFTGSNKG